MKITELNAEEDIQKTCRCHWRGFGHDGCLLIGAFSSDALFYMLQ